MGRKSLTLKAMRASAEAQVPPRLGLRIVVLFMLLQLLLLIAVSLLFPGAACAEAMKGDIGVNTNGGFARLVFTFPEENEAEVRLANGIIVISFAKPIEAAVERIVAGASSYVSAARRDPDGTAVRLALTRKVTVNSMAAGERLFVDLLPDGWVGMPPGVPQDVVDELARRARDAEKKARQAQQFARQRQLPTVKVRLGTHPTFTRYVFELPELIPVAVDRDKEKLTLLFDAPLRFDFTDVKAALPPVVATIESEPGEDAVEVRMAFTGKVDVRTFREDASFIVDVGASDPAAPAAAPGPRKLGELPSLALVPPDDKNASPASEHQSPVTPDLAEKTARTEAPPAPRTPPVGPGPGPKPEPPAATPQAPPPAAAAIDTRPATAPPEPVAAKEAAPLQKPAAPTAGAVASKAAAQDFPPVQDMAEHTAKPDDGAPVVAELQRQGDALRLVFPFAASTPAAVFRRFDTLWLVFDTASPIDVGSLLGDPGRLIRGAEVSRSGQGQVVRLKLERPRLSSASTNGAAWTITLGEMMLDRTIPVGITRASLGGNRAAGVIPFDAPRELHRVTDPEVGDTLLIVTALAPARGVLRTQDFVEFRALASTHGVVIQPLADDVTAELSPRQDRHRAAERACPFRGEL